MPEPIVPSQKASTSSLAPPAESKAAVADSTSRSSAPLSQCSPNWVHPMPTMATRSRIPCDAMCLRLPPHRAGLPEVVVDRLRGGDLSERHLDAIADGDGGGVDIRHLAPEPTDAV